MIKQNPIKVSSFGFLLGGTGLLQGKTVALGSRWFPSAHAPQFPVMAHGEEWWGVVTGGNVGIPKRSFSTCDQAQQSLGSLCRTSIYDSQ